ncbi:hypothetical protein B0T17DRAFT_505885 [Bombardia bombarda]|uniref:Uncharacterized protein n=1 Tax=Bombardia bombarda TaxID=252184 RepID=A0AA39X8J8_9PEZI|nr:hypothetical protein B0T17DRAFT_505885 [Bombardia bombarda]
MRKLSEALCWATAWVPHLLENNRIASSRIEEPPVQEGGRQGGQGGRLVAGTTRRSTEPSRAIRLGCHCASMYAARRRRRHRSSRSPPQVTSDLPRPGRWQSKKQQQQLNLQDNNNGTCRTTTMKPARQQQWNLQDNEIGTKYEQKSGQAEMCAQHPILSSGTVYLLFAKTHGGTMSTKGGLGKAGATKIWLWKDSTRQTIHGMTED